MKIAIITTINHNIGDDFVREGIIYLLGQHFKGLSLKVEMIHKHAPVTVRYGFEKVRNLRVSQLIDLLPVRVTKDRILEADLLVQGGAPVYWCHEVGGGHCADNEWYTPLIRRRYARVKDKVPFINLAAGSCQRYHSDGSEFLKCRKDIEYIHDLYSTAWVTTVRDKLSRVILNSMGLDAPVIPCSSIFARDHLSVEPESADFVALNYMRGGAHYTFGQAIDANRWEATFRAFYKAICNKEHCVFVCHNRDEVTEAKKIDPEAEIFISRDHLDYVKFYAKAKFGIMNRVHGAFMIASFGRPSFVIGNDSRARMVEEIGLKHAFVNDVDLDRLMSEYANLKNGADDFTRRFSKIKQKAYHEYMGALAVLK